MKKFYFLLAFFVAGFSAKAAPALGTNYGYGEPFIFVERGVEFAIFPDGQFDFFFNPRGNFNRVPSHINYSFNSGYHYGPYVQYDDYGAVIQIENVPVYYDYYGRIIQAGRVRIGYNAFGMVNRIGNMFVHYNAYHRFTHTSGFINGRNGHYVYRPWHDYYVRPQNYVVVHHQPYRLYYSPNRMKYSHYRNYYNRYYSANNFQKSYYKPGDQVTSYHRGRRVDSTREIRRDLEDDRRAENTPQRSIFRQADTRNAPATPERVQIPTRTSRVESPAVQGQQVRSARIGAPVTQGNVQQQERNSSEGRRVSQSTRGRQVQAQTKTPEVQPSVDPAPQIKTPEAVSNRGSRSSRGRD